MARDPRCRTVDWNWEQFLHDERVEAMSDAEVGAWVRVLGAMWLAEHPGRLLEGAVRRIAGASFDVIASCLKRDGEHLLHDRTRRDYLAQSQRIRHYEARGRAGGKAKAEKGKTASSMEQADLKQGSSPALLHSFTPSSQKQHPEDLSPLGDVTTNGHSPKKGEPKADIEWREGFVKFFWPDYLSLGRKCSKGEAFIAWMRIPHPDPQIAFDRLDAAYQPALSEWRTRDKQYIPHAVKWLNSYRKDLQEESRNGHLSQHEA